jgi:uncharacterized protein YkwD
MVGLGGCGDGLNPTLAEWTVPPASPPAEVASAPVGVSATSATVTIAPTATPTPAPTPDVPPSATSSPTADPDPPATAAPSLPAELPSEQELFEAEVVELTNAERANALCGAVHTDDRLAAAARAHSEDMVERDFFDHVNPDGDGPGERASAAGYDWWASENIAWGYRTAEDVVAGWMNSPGHRRNILDCDVVAVGVGVADVGGEPYWTQMFGRR